MKNKGFIFSLDATLALFVFVFVLLTINYFAYQSEKSSYVKIQLERVGTDLGRVLDENGTLQNGNESEINLFLEAVLPANYLARISVETYYREPQGFNLIEIREYGSAPPQNASVYGVRHDFVGITNGKLANYSIARISVWEK